jgi:hypothetical protein
MIEFFNHHSKLTRELAMAKADKLYVPLSVLLEENAAHRIVLLLLNHPKSREVLVKMQSNGIKSHIALLRQFIACNWDTLEKHPDIADDDQLNFEYVDCGYKGANHRCPFSTPGDPKPYCIVKSLFNLPYEYHPGNKHHC